MTLESDIVTDEFVLDIDGMDALIKNEVPSQEEEDVWRDP